ncbi:MAG: adenylosuccinate synthase [Thermoplasmata archaeon]
MPAEVVVGAQWGDEGKGKIVDYLSREADYVVRFNGGDNAGHTIRAGGKELKLHLVPSGVLRKGCTAVIGNGVAVNPWRLMEELAILRKQGVSGFKLLISERAHVILPHHILLDGLEEELRAGGRLGTTGRGIGPAFTDKAARLGVTMGDLLERDTLERKLWLILEARRAILDTTGRRGALPPWDELIQRCLIAGETLKENVCDTSAVLNRALDAGKRVLLEGAQGTLLDPDHGTYPYTTSSNAVAGAACTGAGIGPRRIDRVLGVVKAYTTRVGEGPFPTELDDEKGHHLLVKGGEYGTTTGRARRCGWLDLVALRHACRVNGFDALALTKLDVLGGLRKVRVAVRYRLRGRRVRGWPLSLRTLGEARPVYRELEGWPELGEEEWRDIASRGYEALPLQARAYIEFIQSELGTPIELISVGPAREATIDLRKERPARRSRRPRASSSRKRRALD